MPFINLTSTYRALLVALVSISFLSSSFAQQEKLELTFNQEGKLLRGYTDRFSPNVCAACKNDTNVQIIVTIDSTFFSDDKDAIEKKATAAFAALNNPYSILSQLVVDTVALKKIFKGNHFSNDSTEQYIPKKLSKYYDMLSALDKLNIAKLNSLKTDFPLKLLIGGKELKDCMRFGRGSNYRDSCNCYDTISNKSINLIFTIPPSSFKSNDSDSFQLVRTFPLKEAAAEWLEKMIKDGKKTGDLASLRSLDSTIANTADSLNAFYNKLNEYSLFSNQCSNKEVPCSEIPDRKFKKRQLKTELDGLKSYLIHSLGPIPDKCTCEDSLLNQRSILGCSTHFFHLWIAKLIWLNGDKIRLNPFSFTLPSRVSKVAVVDKDVAKIKMVLYDSAIAQLERRMAYRRIDSSDERYMDTLINKRKEFAANLKKDTDGDNKNALETNLKYYNDFILKDQILYQGWFVMYKPNDNKAYKKQRNWIRNYYLDNEDEPLRQKLHYTYSEDENITLLVHNVPAGASIITKEDKKAFSDSAGFTVNAGKAVGQAASLFSLVGGAVPGLSAALKVLNPATPKGIVPPDVEITAYKLVTEAGKVALKNKVDSSVRTGLSKSVGGSLKTINLKLGVLFPDGGLEHYALKAAIAPKGKLYNVDSIQNDVASKLLASNKRKAEEGTVTDTCFTENTLTYISALKQIADAPPLIDEVIKLKKSTVALYYSYKHKLSVQEAPYELDYKLTATYKNDTGGTVSRYIDSSYIKISKFQHLQLAAGLVLSPSAGVITSVDTSNGGFKINRDTDRYRLLVGLRWYPWGLYNQKNPSCLFSEWRWLHRLSVLFATGIPKPLQNFYVGVGVDLVPGLCLSGGVHWQQNNRYTIQNNTIVNTQFRYAANSFVSVTIDPNLLVTAVKSFF